MKSVVKFKNIEHVVELIKNGAIFLNSPFNFNDPLDSYFATLFGRDKRFQPLSIQEYIDIAAELGIFCGTTEDNLTNVLMWTHYADYHRGVALKYALPDNLVGKLDTVIYDNHLHEDFMNAIGYRNPTEMPSTPVADKEESILRSVFLKNLEWKYEDEIRYVKRIKKTESRIEYGWKIEEVYLGCKFLENSETNLEALSVIVNLCLEMNIRLYTMDYNFDGKEKRFILNRKAWLEHENFPLEENYHSVNREIREELKKRLLASRQGGLIQEISREEAKKEFEELWKREMSKLSLSLQMR